MNIAMDNNNQWNHESSNFAAMDSNDYEKAFESYISDVDDDDEGKVKRLYFSVYLSSTISYFFSTYFQNNKIKTAINGILLLGVMRSIIY